MFRTITFLAMLLMLPLVCGADEPKKPAVPAEPAPANPPHETPEIVRLTVQPMAAPIPALKYQLLPELSEMNPGNPIQGYLKCFMEENKFFFGKQAEEDRDKWLEMPLKDLPLEKIRNWGYFGSPLTQADDAARLDTPDWQVLLKLKSEGIRLLVPDVQEIRKIVIALKVRFRAEIAARQFDKAIVTAKTMFAMSRHFCEHPTVVGDLYGFEVVVMALDSLEEMIQQPSCPNLYWALTDLPSPLVSIYKGLQGDRTTLANEFPQLDGNSRLTDAELLTLVDRLDDSIDLTPPGSMKRGDVRKSLQAKANEEKNLDAARERLANAGFDPIKLKEFLPLQVVLLDEVLAFNELRDDDSKAMMLPYWQVQSVLAANRAKKSENGRGRESIFVFLLPPVGVRAEQVRLEQRIALLRCVEALRLYASEHDGRLPEHLDDVQVPVPIDPVSGKPFSYRVDGATATVRGTLVTREASDTRRNTNLYEATMKK